MQILGESSGSHDPLSGTGEVFLKSEFSTHYIGWEAGLDGEVDLKGVSSTIIYIKALQKTREGVSANYHRGMLKSTLSSAEKIGSCTDKGLRPDHRADGSLQQRFVL